MATMEGQTMPRVGGGLELKHSRDASGCVQWHERSGKMLGNARMSGCSWWATRTTSTGQGTNFPASVTIVCWSLEPDERLRESSGLDSPGPPELPEESGWGTPAEGVPYFLLPVPCVDLSSTLFQMNMTFFIEYNCPCCQTGFLLF